MKTRLSPVWVFRFLIFATLILGLALRFAVPMGAARLEHGRAQNRIHSWMEQHKELADGAIEISRGLGEALFIAAVLAAFVDPYAKFRLGKEVGSEIARETVGQHLPEELREALERIQDIDLYQLKMVIHVTLEAVDAQPAMLRWQTAMSFEVKNASWNKHRFEHTVSVSDSAAECHDGRVIAVGHSVDGKSKYDLREPAAELARLCTHTDGSTLFHHDHAEKIASTRLGSTHRYEYSSTTERLVPEGEIQVVQVILPTVGIDLTVHHPADTMIHTSIQYIYGIAPEPVDGAPKETAARWNSERAYLTNEHIWIMYERKKTTDAAQPKHAPTG